MTHPYRRNYKPETICLPPKPKHAASSWWACSYPNRKGWYEAAREAAERLKGAKKVYPSDSDTSRFGDYWKRPRPDERRYVEDDVEREQVA